MKENNTSSNSDLKIKLEALPLLPGCYIFRNKQKHIIYVGKAKLLKNRVKQYFTGTKEGKLVSLVKEIYDIEYMVTPSELDALLLECKLIKQYQPRYNTQLKYSPNYTYIKISTHDPYPTISVTNEKNEDGNYFGFFYTHKDSSETLSLLNSIWKTPICNKSKFTKKSRACLNYHLGKCLAPCEERITEAEYHAIIAEVIRCLRGETRNMVSHLKSKMQTASKEMDFEEAARLRDNIAGLERLKKKSKRLNITFEKKDVFVFLRPFRETAFSIFFIRNNQALHRIDFETNQLELDKLTIFLEEIEEERFWEAKSDNLATCILEIYCEKLFVPIRRKTSVERLVKKLEKEYKLL